MFKTLTLEEDVVPEASVCRNVTLEAVMLPSAFFEGPISCCYEVMVGYT